MLEPQFEKISAMIIAARNKAFQSVNKELIGLYWQIGEYLSSISQDDRRGDNSLQRLADYISLTHPDLRGFSKRGLLRMRQFFETYEGNRSASTLLTHISWSAHLEILAKTKTAEEREFYLKLAIQEKLSVRELRRQLDSAYFERTMLADKKIPLSVQNLPQQVAGKFKDTYVFEFLGLPKLFSEEDLKKALLKNLKEFILEMGKDFSFLGEEYRVQVGMHDYYIDLLFYHRELQCLVPIELKIEAFKPEFLGKLNFYLEALDRDVKKPHENPSIGILLCKDKDDEVVEYAMSRSISPAMIADYSTKLIDKETLKNKLNELFEFSLEEE